MDKQTQNQKKSVIGFCRRKTGKGSNNITKCECMDFVEATHRNQVYPLLYCRMETMGNLDTARLKNAIHLSSKIVPEVYILTISGAGALSIKVLLRIIQLSSNNTIWWKSIWWKLCDGI